MPPVCLFCGTSGVIADLVELVQHGPDYADGIYYECRDQFDCVRRREMNMGPVPRFRGEVSFNRPMVLTFKR